MLVHIQKWGNSLALRIPRKLAKDVRLEEGSAVNLTERAGKIILNPVEGEEKLDDLLARITSSNLHNEEDFGAPRGREVW